MQVVLPAALFVPAGQISQTSVVPVPMALKPALHVQVADCAALVLALGHGRHAPLTAGL